MNEIKIDNSGIGGTPFYTLKNDRELGFTQDDLDNGLCAGVLLDDNTVGKGVGSFLLKVVWLSREMWAGTKMPNLAAVQTRGVGQFKHTPGTLHVNDRVAAYSTGKVGLERFGGSTNGFVMATFEDGTCHVALLGP